MRSKTILTIFAFNIFAFSLFPDQADLSPMEYVKNLESHNKLTNHNVGLFLEKALKEKHPAYLPALWLIFESMKSRSKNLKVLDFYFFRSSPSFGVNNLAEVIVGLGGKNEFKRVVYEFENSQDGSVPCEMLSEMWLIEEIKIILRDKSSLKLSLEPDKSSLPEYLIHAGEYVKESWRYYALFKKQLGLDHKKDSQAKKISYQDNTSDFDQLFISLLKDEGDANEILQKADLFTWDSFCGTGMHSLPKAKNRMRFMVLLKQRKIVAAIGLFSTHSIFSHHLGGSKDSLSYKLIDFLDALGIDKYKLFTGASFTNPVLLYYLADLHTEEAVNIFLKLEGVQMKGNSRLVSRDFKSCYYQAIKNLLSSSGDPDDYRSFFAGGHSLSLEGGQGLPVESISAPSEKKLVDLLCRATETNKEKEVLIDIIEGLDGYGGGGVQKALRGLLKSSHYLVKSKATRALSRLNTQGD